MATNTHRFVDELVDDIQNVGEGVGDVEATLAKIESISGDTSRNEFINTDRNEDGSDRMTALGAAAERIGEDSFRVLQALLNIPNIDVNKAHSESGETALDIARISRIQENIDAIQAAIRRQQAGKRRRRKTRKGKKSRKGKTLRR